jgi:hypothetical protein
VFENRQQFGDSLYSLVSSAEEGIVLCVDAQWGEGKTTFARMWTADLKRQGVHAIHFDAYEHDASDDPFVSFCAEIISLAETKFADHDEIKTLKEDFKSKAMRIGGKLLCTGTKIGAKALTLGILKDSDIEALDDIRSDIADSSSIAVSSFVGKALEDYISSKTSLKDFRDKLSALGAALRKIQGGPLLIIVDELDRCRPDFALALIERIKHLFTTKNVSFVLLANTAQLQNYVKAVYGAKVDAKNYLYKFFTISTELPMSRVDTHGNDWAKYTNKLISHYGINDQHNLSDVLERFFRYYRFTLREMEQCCCILALYYSQLPQNQPSDNMIIPFLAIVRLRYPDIFTDLASSQITYENLVEKTKLNCINHTDYTHFPMPFFLNYLKYLLFSDEEFKTLDEQDKVRSFNQIRFGFRITRTKIMSYLCEELVRFRIENTQ